MERHDIAERHKDDELNITLRTDFTGANAQPISADQLINESGWFPYAFDGESFTFTRTEGIDLALVPFVYVSQFNEATEIATISAEEIIIIAEKLPMPDVVFIQSMARCGTTLANQVLNVTDEIWCLSEPDALDQAISFGDNALIQATVKLMHAVRAKKSARVLGVKFRSQTLFTAEKLYHALPDAKNIFMYRDAVGWANSFYTLFGKFGAVEPYPLDMVSFAWKMMLRETPEDAMAVFAGLESSGVSHHQLFAHLWWRHMAQYDALAHSGVKMHPIRYNEFVADRVAGTKDLFDACGLTPLSKAEVTAAFAADSQEGTFMGKIEKPQRLDDHQKDLLRQEIAKHPIYNLPDHLLHL